MICPRCQTELPADARFCPRCGSPVADGAVPAPVRSKTSPVVLLLIVGAVGLGAVMFCGIIGAVAIPNLLNAIDRGKQKRTMADIRSVGAAIEAYAAEHREYPVAPDAVALRARLEPDFIRRLPTADGWAHPLRLESDESGYRIVSAGKDGVFDGCVGGPVERFDADICFENGTFSQWPEGAQR